MFALSTLSTLTLLSLSPDGASGTPVPALRSYRMIDVDGDGRLDRLEVDDAGSLSISINRGVRQFEPVVQELPQVVVNDVLAEDLNGDGYTDLYLVSPSANAVLLGDGSGRFVEDGGVLGLADGGAGLGAERVDVDGDGLADVLLHNAAGDVVFWSSGTHFERDPAAPDVVRIAPAPAVLPAGPVAPRVAETPAAPSPSSRDRGGRGGGPRVSVSAPAVRAGGAIASGGGGGLDPSIEEVMRIPFGACATSVMDATSGTCLSADSVPAFGALYPLGMEFNILPTGEIGMGTTSPEAGLHLASGTSSQLRITPNTPGNGQGNPEIYLGEGLGVDCGFRVRYDGTSSQRALEFIAECGSPGFSETRMAIHRNLGTVLIGTGDFFTTSAGRGLLRVFGDVSQALGSDGMVKAAVHVNGTTPIPTVSRFFNNLPGAFSVGVTRINTGHYEINFGADVSNRFYTGTIGTATPANAPNATIEVTPRSSNVNALFIEIEDGSGTLIDSQFFVSVL